MEDLAKGPFQFGSWRRFGREVWSRKTGSDRVLLTLEVQTNVGVAMGGCQLQNERVSSAVKMEKGGEQWRLRSHVSSWHKAWCRPRTIRLSNPDTQPRASMHCQLGRYPTVEQCTPNKQKHTGHRPVISLCKHTAPVITTDSGSVRIHRTQRQVERNKMRFSYFIKIK